MVRKRKSAQKVCAIILTVSGPAADVPEHSATCCRCSVSTSATASAFCVVMQQEKEVIFCFYCDRVFSDETTLILHQKGKQLALGHLRFGVLRITSL